MDFLEDLNLSGMSDEAEVFADLIKASTENAISVIESQSKVIADSALRSIKIGNEAIKLLAEGTLDKEGANQILERGIRQVEDLARAEGNLIVSTSVSFLKKISETAVGFVSKALSI